MAGCGGGKVVVYHIPTRQVLTKIQGHTADVNSVCFADRKNSNIIFTGSDDAHIKAWDRRLIGSHMDENKPVGQFLGHN